MKRRTFIESALCLSCMGFITSGCNNLFEGNKLQDKFIYKSKKDLPKKIHLEACSMCQLNCPECTTRKLEKEAPKNWLGYLKFEDFKKFVDEYDFEEIELSNSGEIFLNPELDEIIKYAYQKNIKLTAFRGVNLNKVSDITLENLVKYKFNKITVSLDGATPEIYSIYRRGGDFNKVMENIKKINYFKEKYKSDFPKLYWQFILFGHNEHQIELAKQKAQELNMKIKFRKNSFPSYSPVKNAELVKKQTGLDVNVEDRMYYACSLMFNSPQINWNGDLIGCARIYVGSHGVNVFKDGLLNALNSQNFIYAKQMLTNLSTKTKDIIPCASCSDYETIKKEKTPLSYS